MRSSFLVVKMELQVMTLISSYMKLCIQLAAFMDPFFNILLS